MNVDVDLLKSYMANTVNSYPEYNRMVERDMSLIDKVKPYISAPATDIVRIDYKTDQELYRTMINENAETVVETPSDILFANTVPLKDIEIQIDERNTVFSYGNGILTKYRVVVFEDLNCLQDLTGKKEVGYVIYYANAHSNNIFAIISFGVEKGNNALIAMKAYSVADMPLIMNIFTNTWYAIQIALLHPRIKVLFDNPMRVPIHNHGNVYRNAPRKIKYIKIHKLHVDSVKDIICDKNKYNRKCLCWYVIGHWRKYQTGKEIFIQGYWKGALRDIKKNLDERERIIEVDNGKK